VDPSDLIDWAGLTHVGRHRSSNQDSFIGVTAKDTISFQKRGHLFVVADGMGAHAAGELASKMAVDAIPLSYQKYAKVGPGDALRLAVQTANHNVHNWGQANIDFAGMGTTVTALAVLPEAFYLAHVGDSRLYRVHADAVEQVSRDHSLAQELVQRGQLHPDQVASFGASNVIVRSIGPDAEVKVDTWGPGAVRAGDAFMLCSDGLTRHVSDVEIGWVVSRCKASQACQVLIELANARGGMDNITVIVVRYLGRPEPEPADQEQGDEAPATSRSSYRMQREAAILGGLCGLYVLASGLFHLPAVGAVLTAGIAAGMLWAGLRFRQQAAGAMGGSPSEDVPHCSVTPLDLDAEGVQEVGEATAGSLSWKARHGTEFDATAFWDQKHRGDDLLAAGDLEGALNVYCDVLACTVAEGSPSGASTVTLDAEEPEAGPPPDAGPPEPDLPSDKQDRPE